MRPFGLVLGCERSGTSAIARGLHELGVCMGHELPRPDQDNPQGYFEDELMRNPSVLLSWEKIQPEAWLHDLELSHRGCEAPIWGVKHPTLSEAAPRLIWALRPAFIAITTRKEEKVVASLVRSKHRIQEGFARILWRRRTQGVVRIVRELSDTIPTEVFIMDDHVPDDQLRACLSAIMEEAQEGVIR